MAIRARAAVPLLLAVGLLCATAAVASSWDWEEGRRGEHSPRRCEQRCEERPRHERARCLEDCREQHGEHGRGGRRWEERDELENRRGDHREHGREEEQEREHGRRGHGRESEEEEERQHGSRGGRRGEGREEEEGENRHPYVFGPRSFRRHIRSEQGSIKALRPFRQVSKLLRGIRDYRIAVLEANPRSFILPGHTDAHGIGYVAQGEGVLTTFENGEKRSVVVREGDVFVAPAGQSMYLANTDGRRKLVIVKILHTFSVPGQIQYFFGKAILASFSKRIQRSALRASEERLEKLVVGRQGKQQGDFIVRASEEQIRELRRHASEGGHGQRWPLPPFGGESRGTFNLLDQRPKLSNQHGRLYEADARSFHDLADHDVRVSFANITAGSMTAPFYNTRSVKFAFVLDGEGEVEIVCPHLSRERGSGRWSEEEEDEDEEEQEQYETVRARVSRGSAFVVPVGHPVVEVASRGGNLQIVCFEIRAHRNERVYLAGTNSVLRKWDAPAKQLSFGGASEREVDELLNAQRDQGFLAGPEQQEEGRREREHGRGEEAVETFLRMAAGGL